MKSTSKHRISALHTFGAIAILLSMHSAAIGSDDMSGGWSVVPYVGLSQVDNQSPTILGADNITDGTLTVETDGGFTAGLGIRYDYPQSRWTSEFGWEYRSNDSVSITADGTKLPGGNYASNTLYINGRYALNEGRQWTPWVGAGLTWIQEIDLDSENAEGERSFSNSGSVGYQVMAGFNYALTDRLYITSELRYSSQTGIDLDEESGSGRVTDIDYQPITLGAGLGIRF